VVSVITPIMSHDTTFCARGLWPRAISALICEYKASGNKIMAFLSGSFSDSNERRDEEIQGPGGDALLLDHGELTPLADLHSSSCVLLQGYSCGDNLALPTKQRKCSPRGSEGAAVLRCP
jgi:hypothetical protein